MSDPLFIDRDGHRTWLKWHRARRTAADPAFTGRRILEGLRLGASIEVDLVVHADHGCAILHDLDLDRETTGSGTVAETSAAALRALQLRDNAGQPIAERVMLLEDLCALLTEQQPHSQALLQLDYKQDRAALDAETIRRFGDSVGPFGAHMILTGGDADAINALARTAPTLRTGYDPCGGPSLARLEASGDYQGFIQDALTTAPDAEMIYLHHQIVLAADRTGVDLIAAVHADGRRVDAWTIQSVDAGTMPAVRRLLALRVDQITTDDPEALAKALMQ